jgi:uncharacterized protein (TIGR02453 family)
LPNPYITPKTFRFLSDLKQNNDREWFAENKDRFEGDLREPLLRFIEDFAEPLRMISPHFEASARKSGGSLFRIFRDVRFSKDKTPYKTNAGVHFRHERAKDAHAPGFYLHLDPKESFIGAGIWHPDTETAGLIRRAILDQPEVWEKAVSGRPFRNAFSLDGDSLKRPPAGVPADHPLIEDLKRKDFIAVTDVSKKDLCGPDFLKEFAKVCKVAGPFVKFITEAVGQRY